MITKRKEGSSGISEICVSSTSAKSFMYGFSDGIGHSSSRFSGTAICKVLTSILSSFVC